MTCYRVTTRFLSFSSSGVLSLLQVKGIWVAPARSGAHTLNAWPSGASMGVGWGWGSACWALTQRSLSGRAGTGMRRVRNAGHTFKVAPCSDWYRCRGSLSGQLLKSGTLGPPSSLSPSPGPACLAGGISQGAPFTVSFKSSNRGGGCLTPLAWIGAEETSDPPTRPKVTRRHVNQNLASLSHLLIPHGGRPGNLWGNWFSSRTGEELEDREWVERNRRCM